MSIFLARRDDIQQNPTPQATYRSEAHNTAASASVIVTKPSGVLDGDVLVAIVTNDNGFGTAGAPAGWLQQFDFDDGTGQVQMTVFTKVAASEGASYTFTCNAGTIAAAIIAVSSAQLLLGTDFDDAGSAGNASGTTLVTPSITTTHDGGLILRVVATRPTSGVATASWPTSTEVNDFQQASGKIQLSCAVLNQAAAGATGAETVTVVAGKHVALVCGIAAA